MKFPTKQAFAKWRERHPKLGRTRDGFSCPLAVCLASQGAPYPFVDYEHWWPDYSWNYYWKLPKWAKEYVEYFDTYGVDPPGLSKAARRADASKKQ